MVTEMQLQTLKREIEGYKNDKVRAEATLAEITRNIEVQQAELASEGIHSREDLDKMKNDIDNKYTQILADMEKYRGVRK